MDMTPMVDLFSLLLTFFMLTTTFRPQEPVPVDTPFSISEKPTPDNNIMTLVISKDKGVYFNFDNGSDTSFHFRSKILEQMGAHYNVKFTPEQLQKFEKYNASFGVPIQKVGEFIDAKDPNDRTAMQTGIPLDSADNQLANWILYARTVNPNIKTLIKGDGQAEYPIVKKVLDILQDKNVNRYNLITNLEAVVVKKTE